MKAGPKYKTPTLRNQRKMCPDHWESNPNFIPIPKEKNKLLKVNKEKEKSYLDIIDKFAKDNFDDTFYAEVDNVRTGNVKKKKK